MREPIGTSKFSNISNYVNPSHNLIFVLKANGHMDAPIGESANNPHKGKYLVLLDS